MINIKYLKTSKSKLIRFQQSSQIKTIDITVSTLKIKGENFIELKNISQFNKNNKQTSLNYTLADCEDPGDYCITTINDVTGTGTPGLKYEYTNQPG